MPLKKKTEVNLSELPEFRSKTCPCCGSFEISAFYELKEVPVHSVLLMPAYEAAVEYARRDIVLGFCEICGFIFNLAFDPYVHEYSDSCEETQGFSPTFSSFQKRLAADLISRYSLYNKDIIEIGCGKGEFLTLLCELGNNRGTGFDPAYVKARNTSKAADRMVFINDFYSEKYSGYKGDFIVCKMTLEHIHNTDDFVRTIRASIGERKNTNVFFQVPDVTRILRDCAFEDIYYEHCSYFNPISLSSLFKRCGFSVNDIWNDYDNQYLMIEAQPSSNDGSSYQPLKEDVGKVKESVLHFIENCDRKIRSWKNRLEHYRKQRKKAVLWGSGSKGVSFLTTLNINDEIDYAVDINPYRQGFFMPGTGHKIVAPEFLKVFKPDVVVVMNEVYRDEIERDLRSMGLAPEIITV